MTEPDLTLLRRYTRAEAADKLNIPEAWLKQWVHAESVPFQRKGAVRGAWFTYADIARIGGMLPGLMSPRKANSRAERDAHAAMDGSVVAAEDPDVLLTRYEGLRSVSGGTGEPT